MLLADKSDSALVYIHRKGILVCLLERTSAWIFIALYFQLCLLIYLLKCFLLLCIFICLALSLFVIFLDSFNKRFQKQQMCFLSPNLGFGAQNKKRQQRIALSFSLDNEAILCRSTPSWFSLPNLRRRANQCTSIHIHGLIFLHTVICPLTCYLLILTECHVYHELT